MEAVWLGEQMTDKAGFGNQGEARRNGLFQPRGAQVPGVEMNVGFV